MRGACLLIYPSSHYHPAAYVLDSDQSAERGLLVVVLALIQLAGGKLGEGEPSAVALAGMAMLLP